MQRRMSYIKLEDVSCDLWRSFNKKPPFQNDPDKIDDQGNVYHPALMVSWEISAAYYGYNPDGNTKSKFEERCKECTLQFLFCQSTTVFMQTTLTTHLQDMNAFLMPHTWKCVSKHVSEWADFTSNVGKIENSLRQDVVGHLPQDWQADSISWLTTPASNFIRTVWIHLKREDNQRFPTLVHFMNEKDASERLRPNV